MNYEEFKSAIVKMADEAIEAPKTVTIHSVTKNNGLRLDGLVIMEKDTNLAPNIYLNTFYEAYRRGTPLEEILDTILDIYRKHRIDVRINTDFLSSYDDIRGHLVYRLISYSRNEALLNEIPHIRFLDLAIVFYCFFQPPKPVQNGTILIRNEHISSWNIAAEDLFTDARVNTCRQLPPSLTSLQSMMERIMQEMKVHGSFHLSDLDGSDLPDSDVRETWTDFLSGDPDSPIPMFVLSNTSCSYGAACVLYEDLLLNYAKSFSCDFYILPSSIHEVILVPALNDSRLQEMSDMVRRVNETTLPPDEILSDHAYYYSRVKNRITL